MGNCFAEATDSLEQDLHWIEQLGRKDSADWRLVDALLKLAQGLQNDHDAEEDRRKSFARSWRPGK